MTASRPPGAPFPDVWLRAATIEEILPVRHAVLRPGRALETARFDGDLDPATRHFGGELRATGEIVACVSCLRRPDAWQIRGMATRADRQGRGIGSALLGFALETLRAAPGPPRLWCNARVTALDFWLRNGWTVASDVFDIPGVGPHRVLERVR